MKSQLSGDEPELTRDMWRPCASRRHQKVGEQAKRRLSLNSAVKICTYLMTSTSTSTRFVLAALLWRSVLMSLL